jgi:hypothetical protein
MEATRLLHVSLLKHRQTANAWEESLLVRGMAEDGKHNFFRRRPLYSINHLIIQIIQIIRGVYRRQAADRTCYRVVSPLCVASELKYVRTSTGLLSTLLSFNNVDMPPNRSITDFFKPAAPDSRPIWDNIVVQHPGPQASQTISTSDIAHILTLCLKY